MYLDDQYVGSEWFAQSGVVVYHYCINEVKHIVLKSRIICQRKMN